MSSATIEITVGEEAARRWAAAPPEQRRKVELLLRLRLRELTEGPRRTLAEIMDEIGASAAAQGLTAEDVEALLREN